MRLMEILVAREFLEVFPENLPGLPLGREVEVSIEVLPGTTLVSQAPYRMAPIKFVGLKT